MKQKDLLTVLIPLFILTVLWVAFTVYHNFSTSTIQDPLTIQIIPIKGSFDLKTLDSLKSRTRVEPQYSASTISELSPSPSPDEENPQGEEETSASASESAQPTTQINRGTP
jgi:hypothetical protein